MNTEQNELLNWQQACKLLGCSKSYFYNLVNSGKIKALCLGEKRGIRVYKNSCLQFLRLKNL